jgi:TonB family protein
MLARRVVPVCFSLAWLVGCAGGRAPETSTARLGNTRYPNCPDTAVLEIAGRPAYRPCSVDRPVLLRPDSPRPRLPPSASGSIQGARVLAEFVVDEQGRVEPGTAEILASPDSSLTQAVWAVLPELRFTPAERDGRRVRQQVSVPFEF